VAEETKVAGVEATIRRTVPGQTFSLTAGGFKNGDTSGTELTFRGWALHDLKSPVFGRFPLPPLSTRMAARQAPSTTPLAEIDGRYRLLRPDRVATVVGPGLRPIRL
jgi:hypothetical protein